jgi:uncharacterized protein (DUF2164 family)
MAIQLFKETQKTLVASIQRYFAEHMDEEIGDLKAMLLLDFVLQEVGPSVYNQAITDAQAHMLERVNDLDGSCYELEFAYWKK